MVDTNYDTDPRPLTRKELAEFLPSQRAIRAFEKLFDLIPIDVVELFALVEAALLESGTANANAVAALGQIKKAIQNVSVGPDLKPTQKPKIDYLDFNPTVRHVDKVRRMVWNDDQDTLNLHHTGGVSLQVGLEEYSRVTNNQAYDFDNGEVVGLGLTTPSDVDLFIADGSFPSIYVIGICTQDILQGETGRLTVRGQVNGINTTGSLYGETWAVGDILYASPTIAGGMTNAKPTAPDLCIPVALVLVAHATLGAITVRPTIEQDFFYGSFLRLTDATVSAANTATALEWDTIRIEYGVELDGGNPSRIYCRQSGLYKFAVALQLTSGSASQKNIWIWFRKNGTDIANTATITTLETNNSNNAPSKTLTFSMDKDDYIEIFWAADSTNVTMNFTPATAFSPATAAAFLEVTQEHL